jgi:hypothetical protein
VTAQSSSSSPSELSTPGSGNPWSPSTSALPVLENVGQKVNVLHYAAQEWQGNTRKAKTILQVILNSSTILNNSCSP